LKQIDYPSNLYDVFVVADHCTDETYSHARSDGVYVFERKSGKSGRKGLALHWLFKNYLSSQYDAVVIFDADSIVDPKFLRYMNDRLNLNESIIQGQHVIANEQDSVVSAYCALAMHIDHIFYNLGRYFWGLPAKLMGDGTCLRRQIVNKFWSGDHITEDNDLRIRLIKSGYQISYEYRALSSGKAVRTWSAYHNQMKRWFYGVSHSNWTYFKEFFSNKDKLANGSIDSFLGSVLPGFSLLSFLYVMAFFLSLGVTKFVNPDFIWVTYSSFIFICFMALIPILGLWVNSSPSRYYRYLFYFPLVLFHKLKVVFHTLKRRSEPNWIRTER
jgi:cellulose synthase/poly-beta-1,6-N-acetylglucosamine synthase-like glycosyltransferase